MHRHIRNVALVVRWNSGRGLPSRLAVHGAGSSSTRPQSTAPVALVPCGLWNVADRGRLPRAIGWRPILCRVIQIVELCSAHARAVRGRAQSIHRSSLCCCCLRRRIASRCTVVARRDEHRHPLRGCLRPRRIPERVASCTERCLAQSIAQRYDRRDIMVHRVLRR